MARSLNRCEFIGRLTRDPEARYLPDGTAIVKFTIAVDDETKDRQSGQKVDKAEFVPIVGIGKLAEICIQYLKKGKQVYVDGKFRTRKYADKDGIDRWSTEVAMENMQMLGGRDDGGSSQAPARPARPAPAGRAAPEPSAPFDDEIPF